MFTKASDTDSESTGFTSQGFEMLSAKIHHANRAPARKISINVTLGEKKKNSELLSFEVRSFLERIRNTGSEIRPSLNCLIHFYKRQRILF